VTVRVTALAIAAGTSRVGRSGLVMVFRDQFFYPANGRSWPIPDQDCACLTADRFNRIFPFEEKGL
jgi:hypothetical protein